jgi:rhodanese-related sulfurtransferase
MFVSRPIAKAPQRARTLAGTELRAAGLEPSEAMALSKQGAVVVDLRSDLERRRRGEIPHALLIDRAALHVDTTTTVVDRLTKLAGPDGLVILVSSHGRSSSSLADVLRRRGVHATDVRGGFVAWERQGYAVAPSRHPTVPA